MRYVSLGFNCNPALCLRNLGLSKETQVFDWLVTTPSMVEELIRRRFEGFADMDSLSTEGMFFDMKNQVFLVPGRKTKFYHTTLGPIFIHDGHPTKMVEEKYTRRSKRFLDLLEGDDEILFIFCGKPSKKANERNDHTIKNLKGYTYDHTDYLPQLVSLKNFIQETYPDLTFHILAFNVDWEVIRREYDCLTTWTLGSFSDRPYLERPMKAALKSLLVDCRPHPSFSNLNKFLKI